jgi:transposase
MFVSSYTVEKYYQYEEKEHHLPTIKRIPDDVWNEIKNILPKEKPHNTKGHPAAVSFRQVLDGILFVLRTGSQWKMLPKEYGSGSTCRRRFQQWVRM